MSDTTRDASVGDGAGADATTDAAPAPRCDTLKPFGTPLALAALNTSLQELGATLSTDELTIIYSASTELRLATRSSRTNAFGSPAPLAGVDPAGIRHRPSLTADGLSLYLAYQPDGSADANIHMATRASTASAFGSHASVAALNTTNHDRAPFVVANHSALYFVSDRSGTAQFYRSARTSTTFGPASLVTGTNLQTGTQLDSPTLTPDELSLYFSAERPGGAGASDIWVARRTSAVTGFGEPVLVAELSSQFIDVPAWISADDCVLYFSRTSGGTTPIHDLYVASKP